MSALTAYDPLEHTSIYQRIEEDSDDSDGEGGLGNVSRVIIRPPGHSGKAKRGHLCFDASFETGNLGRVDLVSEFEYDLFIRPDSCSPRFRFWFNFTVDNVKQDQRVIFNIVNLSKSKNLFSDQLTPLVKSSSRPKWQRIPKRLVYYHRSQAHQGHYILSFAFGFDKEDDVFQFALSPPYSYSRLQTYLTVLEKKATYLEDIFSREVLCKSVVLYDRYTTVLSSVLLSNVTFRHKFEPLPVHKNIRTIVKRYGTYEKQKRHLDVVTIGKLQNPQIQGKKRVVIIMARVHAGESPSSFVCQGLLEMIISAHPVARVLREYVIFKIIPMLNPDGVFLGNYRTSLLGFDLNRSWHIASPWAHPTLHAVIEMLTRIDKDKEFQLDFIIDIHSHTSLKGCFIYGNTYENVYRYERHTVFPKLLAGNADDCFPTNMMFNADANKKGTARRFFCTALSDKVNSYTLEVSVLGYHLPGTNIFIPYTEESYMRCGRNLLRSILEYYQVVEFIPMNVLEELVPKKKRRPRTHRSTSSAKNLVTVRPKTTRSNATIHFTDININYDSSTSFDDILCSARNNFSPTRQAHEILTPYKKVGGGFMSKGVQKLNSPPPPTYDFPPIPSLSIIDFNQITRGSLEKATQKNKHKI